MTANNDNGMGGNQITAAPMFPNVRLVNIHLHMKELLKLLPSNQPQHRTAQMNVKLNCFVANKTDGTYITGSISLKVTLALQTKI